MLRYLHESGSPDLVKTVPKVPLPAPRDVTVTEAERDLFLNAAPMYLRCWLLLCSDLALRSGTAARVAPEHYDTEKQQLSIVTKAGRCINLPVTDELARLFAAIPHQGEPRRPVDTATPYPCQLHSRKQVTVTTLRCAFWKLRQQLGVTRNLRPHDLRRTTAVKALELTGDLRMVQALLGHTQLRSTLHYLDHRNQQVSKVLVEQLAKRTP